jgi:hypothetical protein
MISLPLTFAMRQDARYWLLHFFFLKQDARYWRLHFFVNKQDVRYWLLHLFLVSAVNLLCGGLATVQAKAALKAIVLPQTVTRSVIVENSEWQGAGVELEHLHSPTKLEATLEQLAMLLPDLTPVWSEQGVVRAHWSNDKASYVLFLWATEIQGTEGLLSGLALDQPNDLIQKTLAAHFTALDWLPSQAVQLFRFVDRSNGHPIVLTSLAVPMLASRLIDHLITYAQQNGWLRLHDELTFFRDTKRLSFQVNSNHGNTTVVVYETSRDAP